MFYKSTIYSRLKNFVVVVPPEPLTDTSQYSRPFIKHLLCDR